VRKRKMWEERVPQAERVVDKGNGGESQRTRRKGGNFWETFKAKGKERACDQGFTGKGKRINVPNLHVKAFLSQPVNPNIHFAISGTFQMFLLWTIIFFFIGDSKF
jgi:hypothetical protein